MNTKQAFAHFKKMSRRSDILSVPYTTDPLKFASDLNLTATIFLLNVSRSSLLAFYPYQVILTFIQWMSQIKKILRLINLQASKNLTSCCQDHWFAYTNGVPNDRPCPCNLEERWRCRCRV